MSESVVLKVMPLGFPWTTVDPFLFCVHHLDSYPAGNEQMGPDASLSGRNIGMDFQGRDGWSMYHGDVVPGFPRHPHRGFETITIARRGFIDHADSLGAKARFGEGDVQWMTAGKGVVHSEMFPCLDRQGPNTTELFQIWLNLPRAGKFVEPHFTMFWNHTIPVQAHTDDSGRTTEVSVVAGKLADLEPPSPPPDSFASQPDSDVAVWTVKMSPGASWTIPAASPGTHRMLYFFVGETLDVAGTEVSSDKGVQLKGDVEAPLVNGPDQGEILILQGRPIGEPVAHHGPFVMNTQAEIRQAMMDYHRTQFGGWPWSNDGPVHPRESGRFAVHADGRVEEA
jgi:redox-sensitive bicupin YhaK (pirin superfamily)